MRDWKSFWFGVVTVIALEIGATVCALATQVILAILAIARYG